VPCYKFISFKFSFFDFCQIINPNTALMKYTIASVNDVENAATVPISEASAIATVQATILIILDAKNIYQVSLYLNADARYPNSITDPISPSIHDNQLVGSPFGSP
jgi:hypothetical protein